MTNVEEDSQALDIELKRLEVEKKKEEIKLIRDKGKRQWITPAAFTTLLPLIGGLGIWILSEVKEYNAAYRSLTQLANIEAENDRLQGQKDSLNIEITSLVQLKEHYSKESKELQSKIEKRQVLIDQKYLQMLFDSNEAEYAIGHIRALDLSGNSVTDDFIKELTTQLTPEIRASVNRIAADRKIAIDLARISREILTNLGSTLKLLPASDWTQSLAWSPEGLFVDRRKIMATRNEENPKYYDVALGRFLTEEETKQLRQ